MTTVMAAAPRNGSPLPGANHTLEIVKTGQKRSNPVKLESQINKIIDRALKRGRMQRGWRVKLQNDATYLTPKMMNGEWRWAAVLHVTNENTKRTQQVLDRDFDQLIEDVGSAGAINGWLVEYIDGRRADAKKDSRVQGALGYAPVEIPPDWDSHFNHIFDRESQIEILVSCIKAAIDSEFANRFHCALVGDPACGKTDTLHGVKAALGQEAILEYDATATTQAGAIQDLDNREELPRILIVEEIEKTDPDSLRWLLGVMDHRGEIRKVTARKQIYRETRLLTLATVNDYPLFLKIMYGALASRFTYHLHFPRPDRTLLKRILEREVAKVKGDRRWIKPSLDYAESENIYDPRKVTAICLCGREQLLDGTYQRKLKSCAGSNFLREITQRQKKEKEART